MKLTILDVKYSVNAKKKAVTCVINASVTDEDFYISRVIPKKFRKLNPDMWENTTEIEPIKYIKSVAVTRLVDGDEFDEDLGKEIAKTKCKVKLYKEVEKYTLVVLDVVYDVLNKKAFGFRQRGNIELWTYEEEALGIVLPEKIFFENGERSIECNLRFDEIHGVSYYSNDNHIILASQTVTGMQQLLKNSIKSVKNL